MKSVGAFTSGHTSHWSSRAASLSSGQKICRGSQHNRRVTAHSFNERENGPWGAMCGAKARRKTLGR
eukprot:1658059-Rhodomonas_salina.2